MAKERKGENATNVVRQGIKPAPSCSDAWAEFERNLAVALADLEEDDFLILASNAEHYYVPFAGQG